MLVQLLLFNIGAHDERKRLCCVCMLLLAGGLLSTPPAWTVRSPTGIYTSFHRESSAIGFSRMSLHTIHSSESLAQSYAGIFAQSPGIAKAWAVPHIEEDTETVILQRTARDIEGNKVRSFVQSYELTNGKWRQTSPFPLELKGAVSFSPSPSGKLLAIVREDSTAGNGKVPKKEPGYVIEIWGNEEHGGELLDQIPTAGSHGKIISDSWFGGLGWAPDESKLVYVAQKKAVETKLFFSKPEVPSKIDNHVAAAAPGDQFLYEEDWGEKYDGVSRLGLFVADLSGTGKVEQIPGISAELTPGQPRFSPDGTHIVYTGWQCEPRKLGMIYCYQRPCNLYSAPVAEMLMNMERENDTPDNREVDGSSEAQQKEAGPNDEQNAKSSEMEQKQGKPKTHKCLCPSWRLARSARFSPSGDRLIWLSREEGFDTHGGCFRLTSAPWDVKAGNINVGALKTLVDIVRVPDTSSDGAGFPGLWVDSLPDACFTPDGSSVYVTSAWGSRQSVVKVDVETGLVERVVAATAAARQDSTIGDSNDASASVLAVGKGGVYVAGSSPNSPGGFAVVSPQTGEPIVGPAIGGALVTSSVRIKRGHIAKLKTALGGVRWSVLSVPVGEAPQQEPPFEAILLMPPSAPQQMTESASPKGESSKVPLVVVPHGGPHGVIPTVFIPAYAFLCATQGVAVIHVNFRGSTGFGTEALDSLPGRIGTNDVADVVSATKAALALESDRLDPERVGVIGGSHGGFLGAHLTAQHPEIFKVAALRNPVTNIASMVTVSDIPDWCYIEALGRGKYDFGACRPPTAEELRTMWEMSPVKHVKGVKAPTLVALGAKDRRVPQSQGLEWYRALRSQGVEARLLIYPDDVHAIDQPASEADQWLNIIAWFNTHLG